MRDKAWPGERILASSRGSHPPRAPCELWRGPTLTCGQALPLGPFRYPVQPGVQAVARVPPRGQECMAMGRHLGTRGRMDIWSQPPGIPGAPPPHLLSVAVSSPGSYLAIYFW